MFSPGIVSVTTYICLYADLRSVCEGLTAPLCCLASVVRLASTQTLGLSVCRWWLAARLKAWPGAQGLLYKYGAKGPCLENAASAQTSQSFSSLRVAHFLKI